KLMGGGTAFVGDSVGGPDAIRVDTTMANDPSGYSVFSSAAANPSNWLLEFDLTFAPGAWTGTDFADGSTHWTFPIVGLSYDDGTPGGGGTTGFGSLQLGTNLYNSTGTSKISIPLNLLTAAALPLPNNSNYYQVQIGANQRFMTPPSGGVDYHIDKLRLTAKPLFTPVQLFSWETPDNPATTGVNEALEGWSGNGLTAANATTLNDQFAHTVSVTDYTVNNMVPAKVFPTHGNHSLKIDTTSQDPAYVHPQNTTGLRQSYGFRWGTNLAYDSTIDADNTTMTAEETVQAGKIADLASKLNGAFSIEFDIALSDPQLDADPDGLGVFQGGNTASLPNFLSIAMHISDGRGSFFQYDIPAIGGAELQEMILDQGPDGVTPDEPITMSVPMSGFTDRSSAALGALTNSPIPTNTDFLRIGLALNFGTGPVIVHLDNFRVLTTISLEADFDNDLDVDGQDLQVWKSAFGQTPLGDANGDGRTDGSDFVIWQRELGNDGTPAVGAAAAVPEPASAALLVCGLAAAAWSRRRTSR
ncbi:MAG TPA: hypothetical protein VEQ85_05525, partial [Lacipirellulaceae bacterium]|nr:hypothetical protein [Lacipirellulaceae bacterium]